MAVSPQSRLVAVPPRPKETPSATRITPLDLMQLNRAGKDETQTDRSVRSLSSVLAQMSQTAQKTAPKKPEVTPFRLKEIDASVAAAELTRAALFEPPHPSKSGEDEDEVATLLAVLG